MSDNGDRRAATPPLQLTREAIVAAVAAAQASDKLPTGDHPAPRNGTSPAIDWGGPARGSDLVPAAVLVPLVLRASQVTVLLTQRTAHLRHHPGQISFPGGHIEPADADAETAALREAHEEIGLTDRDVEVIGRLAAYETGTGFEVTPVVGLVAAAVDLVVDRTEVDEVFEVPLSFVLDPANHLRETRIIGGRRRRYYVLPYEDRYIWGATAGILVNLSRILTA